MSPLPGRATTSPEHPVAPRTPANQRDMRAEPDTASTPIAPTRAHVGLRMCRHLVEQIVAAHRMRPMFDGEQSRGARR